MNRMSKKRKNIEEKYIAKLVYYYFISTAFQFVGATIHFTS